MLDGFLVTFSPLLLEDDFHLALRMFDDGGLDLDLLRWYDRVATERELTRANLVHLRECKDVSDFHVIETRDGEKVAGCEQVFAACDGSYDISLGLSSDERERRGGRDRRRGCESGLGLKRAACELADRCKAGSARSKRRRDVRLTPEQCRHGLRRRARRCARRRGRRVIVDQLGGRLKRRWAEATA